MDWLSRGTLEHGMGIGVWRWAQCREAAAAVAMVEEVEALTAGAIAVEKPICGHNSGRNDFCTRENVGENISVYREREREREEQKLTT